MTQTPMNADDHFEALGDLLSQLRNHLMASAEKKGTYSDYLRLLEFYQNAPGAQWTNIVAGWVDTEHNV